MLAEELGYDSIWLYDHVHNVPRPAHEAMFECWTTHRRHQPGTSRVRLGQMVGCNPYREPGLLAKITSNIDVISGGRLDWGIGAGWYENEYKGYGFEFPPPRDRIGMLRETRRDREVDVDRARDHLRGPVLRDRSGPLRPQAGAAAPPARSGSAAAASSSRCGSWPGSPTARTSAASPTSCPQVRGAQGPLRRRSAGTTTRSARPGRPRSSSARPRPRWRQPAAARSGTSRSSRWRGGQPGRDARAGVREGPDLPRPRLRGFRAVVRDYPDTETLDAVRQQVMPEFR